MLGRYWQHIFQLSYCMCAFYHKTAFGICLALTLFLFPVPPYFCPASCIRSVPSPVCLSYTYILTKYLVCPLPVFLSYTYIVSLTEHALYSIFQFPRCFRNLEEDPWLLKKGFTWLKVVQSEGINFLEILRTSIQS